MRLDESYLARRRFLCGMLGGGVAALGTGIAAPTVPYVLNLQSVPLPPFLELEPADYDLRPGSWKIIRYGRIPALLLKTPEPESALKAFVAICTHLDCTVGYRPDQNRIVCACHEGCYDTDGRVVSGPPPRPLREFHTGYREDNLILALEKDDLEKALPDPKP
jgi:nitrite reductase/ring-hydroxylating ferredoxin subunit